MLALDGIISSDEINRAILRVENEDDLAGAIERIQKFRAKKNLDELGDELVTEDAKNDRIIVWMAWASFGWTLLSDKRASGSDGYYSISPNARRVVTEAARIRHKHREFATEKDYVEHISACAGLPEDLR